jgi:methenyltetrahydrofolate cyclohydrolase
VAGFLDASVREFLDGVAADASAPGAGSVAALVAAAAAGLAAMVARGSPDWDEAGAVVAQAEMLRERLTPMAPDDAEAWEAALAALGLPADLEAEARNTLLAETLERAAALPLAIAAAAADVAQLAATCAEHGNPALRPDAAAAAMLAEGAARAAAHLVEINLTVTAEDERVVRARRAADDAAAASGRALAGLGET